MMRHPTLAAVCLLAPLAGCSSPWRESYRPFAPQAALADGAPVSVREIPWERMERALAESEQRAAASDVHPSDWTEDQRTEARRELLANLQITADPAAATVVGLSSFRATDPVKPWAGSLERFARSVGATHAVWAERYLGKADAIVNRTVYIDSFEYDTDDDSSAYRTRVATVPIVIGKDETGYTAFFIRIDP
jgi:hypothetical protein